MSQAACAKALRPVASVHALNDGEMSPIDGPEIQKPRQSETYGVFGYCWRRGGGLYRAPAPCQSPITPAQSKMSDREAWGSRISSFDPVNRLCERTRYRMVARLARPGIF